MLKVIVPFSGKELKSFFKDRFVYSLVAIMLSFFFLLDYNSVQKEKEIINEISSTYIKLYAEYLSASPKNKQIDLDLENVIIGKYDIPFIIVDENNAPTVWYGVKYKTYVFFNGEKVTQYDKSNNARIALLSEVEKMKAKRSPIEVLFFGEYGKQLGYIYYGDSVMIRNLSRRLLLEFIVLLLVLSFLVFEFLNKKSAAHNRFWIGIAKETAHQLGTPVSSLLGWHENLKCIADEMVDDEAKNDVKEVAVQMNNDLIKLNRVINRFSQIGSMPILTEGDINKCINDVTSYFRKRLPQFAKQINIITNPGNIPSIKFNKDLIEWVLENLLKNSMDAIVKQEGIIELETEYFENKKKIIIYHSDNGKGIKKDSFKKIFNAGYTSKKRGWGLGLTLSKRIVEDYHNGKIYVSSSEPGAGTVFAIELPV